MLRRVAIGLIVFLLIAALGLGLLAVERKRALQALIDNRLGALGLSDVTVEVGEVEISHAVLSGVTAGEAVQAARIVISYDLRHLLDLQPPRIDSIDIEGLVVDAGALDRGPIARFREMRTDADTDGGAPLSLPIRIGPIRLHDAMVSAPTPWGDATLRIDGAAGPIDPDAIPVEAKVLATSAFGQLDAELRGTASLLGNISGEITLASERFVMADLTAVGIAGRIEGAITRDRVPTLDGKVSFQALDLGDIRIGTGRFATRFQDGIGSAELTVSSPHHKAELRLSAEETDDPLRPRMAIGLDAEVDAASSLLSLVGAEAPRAGRATVSVVADGRADFAAPLPSAPAAIVQYLTAGSWRASVAADLTDVAHDQLVAGLSATAGLDLAAVDDVLMLTLPAPILLDAAEIDAAALQRAGLPPEFARQFAGAFSASIGARHADAAQARIAFAEDTASFSAIASVWSESKARVSVSSALDGTVRLTPIPRLARLAFDRLDAELRDLSAADQRFSRIQLSASGTLVDERVTASGLLSSAMPSLAQGNIAARDIAAELPLEIELTPARVVARQTGPANVRLGDVAVAEALQLLQPLELVLTPRGDTSVVVPFDDVDSLQVPHDLVLTSNDIEMRVVAGDDRPLVRITPLTIDLAGALVDGATHRGRARISTQTVQAPAYDLTAGGIDVTVGTGARIEAAFTVAEVAHPSAPPLMLAGDAVLDGDAVTFALRPKTADTDIEIDIRGSHDLAAAEGRARIEVPTLTFSSGALQPEDLTAFLSDLTDVSGAVDAVATVDWGADGVDGTAEVGATDMSFTAAGVNIAGLSTTLNFTSLLPLASRPAQPLTIRTIDAGVPLRDLSARLGFALDDAGNARLDLPAATVAFAGGRISLADAGLDTGQAENRLTLQFDRVDLAELLKLVQLEGLSGTGVLNGSLPVVIRDNRIAVVDGALRTAGSGVLRYRSPTARQALESGGESVDLLLQALENFQYDTLSFSVDKRLDGETELRLQTTGSNPDVLDGYPFAININLSGNADQILASVLEGFRLSDSALRAIVR